MNNNVRRALLISLEAEIALKREQLQEIRDTCPHEYGRAFCLEGGGWVCTCDVCDHIRDATDDELPPNWEARAHDPKQHH